MCSSCFALVRSCARATPQKRTMVRNNATGVCVMTACSTTLRLPFDRLLCGCQVANAQMLLCFFFLLNHPRPNCYAWHGIRPSHLLEMRPSLRHQAPGSLSQGSNRQESLSPGSACRRVVPWCDVSSWVQGAE